jgi:glutamate-1-semialdehyde aminotransferase
MDGLKDISNRHGIPTLIQGPRGVFFYQFMDKEVAYSVRDLQGADVQKQARFRELLAEEGILIMWRGRWYVSGALADEDVDKTLDIVDGVMGRL